MNKKLILTASLMSLSIAMHGAVYAGPLNCSQYKISKQAAMSALINSSSANLSVLECTDMIRDGTFLSLSANSSLNAASGKCVIYVQVSGIKNGNSKSCAGSGVAKLIENEMIKSIE